MQKIQSPSIIYTHILYGEIEVLIDIFVWLAPLDTQNVNPIVETTALIEN